MLLLGISSTSVVKGVKVGSNTSCSSRCQVLPCLVQTKCASERLLKRFECEARRIAKPDAALKVARYVLSDAPRQRMLQELQEVNVEEVYGQSPPQDTIRTQTTVWSTLPPLGSGRSLCEEKIITKLFNYFSNTI